MIIVMSRPVDGNWNSFISSLALFPCISLKAKRASFSHLILAVNYIKSAIEIENDDGIMIQCVSTMFNANEYCVARERENQAEMKSHELFNK